MAWTKPIRLQSDLTPEEIELKAWLLGFIAGDGSIDKDKRVLTLCPGCDKEMAFYLAEVVDRLYRAPGEPSVVTAVREVQPKLWHNGKRITWEPKISRVEVIRDILGLCPGWREVSSLTTSWDIPEWIRQSPALRRRFVSGLADADGCVTLSLIPQHHHRRLSIVSVNRLGLLQVQEVLSWDGIRSEIASEPNRGRGSFVLYTQNEDSLRLYAKLYGFKGREKSDKLQLLIDSYSNPARHTPEDSARVVSRIEELIALHTPIKDIAVKLTEETKKPWNRDQVCKAIIKHKIKSYGKGNYPKTSLLGPFENEIREWAQTLMCSEVVSKLQEKGVTVKDRAVYHFCKKAGIRFREGRRGARKSEPHPPPTSP